MASNFQRIQPGTNVYGSDDNKVGDVSEVGSNYVLVRQGWLFTKDIFIPMSAITGVDEDGVRLNVTKDQIGDMGWDLMPEDTGPTATYGTSMSSATDMDDTGSATIMDNSRSTMDMGDTTTSTAQGTGAARTDYSATQTRTDDMEAGDEVAIPIVEEELRVGKRAVESGGVRVTTHVEEVPFNEQVTVREETVDVQRRPADRPASDADFAALQQGTLEVRERHEEVVVDKQARIVEEVVIDKQVGERTETIQDTVRRTDVNVQEIPGQTRTSGSAGTSRTTTSDEAGIGSRSSTHTDDVSAMGGNEGAVEGGLSRGGNAAERATGLDLDRDRDVGQRDPRDNY